jgi:hypothetical protein
VSRAAALDDLVARRDIGAVLTRYCRALDRADLDLMKTVYWPDGIDVHGIFEGNAHAFAEYIIQEIQVFFEMGTHCLLNCHIDVDGDVAASETYLYSVCRVRTEQREAIFGSRFAALSGGRGLERDRDLFIMAGRYLDRFQRRDGEWRIARRQVIHDWNDGNASNQIMDQGHFRTIDTVGAWGRADPVYALRR